MHTYTHMYLFWLFFIIVCLRFLHLFCKISFFHKTKNANYRVRIPWSSSLLNVSSRPLFFAPYRRCCGIGLALECMLMHTCIHIYAMYALCEIFAYNTSCGWGWGCVQPWIWVHSMSNNVMLAIFVCNFPNDAHAGMAQMKLAMCGSCCCCSTTPHPFVCLCHPFNEFFVLCCASVHLFFFFRFCVLICSSPFAPHKQALTFVYVLHIIRLILCICVQTISLNSVRRMCAPKSESESERGRGRERERECFQKNKTKRKAHVATYIHTHTQPGTHLPGLMN